MIKVLVYPKADNPYQDLLYSHFSSHSDVMIEYFTPIRYRILPLELIFMPIGLLRKRLEGFSIFHIHWLYEFQAPGFANILVKVFFTLYVFLLLIFIKLIGFKLVWTVHDVVPHQKLFLNDPFISRQLASISDKLIFLNKSTVSKLEDIGGINHNTSIIPLGNYTDQYPNEISHKVARAKLNIEASELVFLYFGRIEEYKGVVDLLRAFSKLNMPLATLVVAGKCYDSELSRTILQFSSNSKIRIVLGHVPDTDIQIYMNASDIVVAPYKYIENSSTISLASSFKKPSIYPNIGGLRDFPPDLGIRYEQNDNEGLMKALLRAQQDRRHLSQLGLKSYKYIKQFSWENLASATEKVYFELT